MRRDPFTASGALAAAYDAVDWADTPLGPVAGWTSTLRNAVDLTLSTRFPATLLWGPDYVLVYNEAYTELIAGKHPAALGRPAAEVFPEIWDVIGPMLDEVRSTGTPTWVEDSHLPLQRSTFLEECYFTFSYSAVIGTDGEVEGVLDIAAETTTHVLSRRRLGLLSQLAAALGDVQDLEGWVQRSLPVLRSDPEDLPLVALLLPGDPVPSLSVWGEAPVGDGRELRLVPDDAGAVAWQTLSAGAVLLVRLSPHLPVAAPYLDFLRLIGAQLDQTLTRVLSLQDERELSAALQRALLTRPEVELEVDVGARYSPAAQLAQVGGDWYDAFRLPDGSTMLAIGDVAGHDQHAAAAMAQLRNLVRGIACTLPGASPAQVLAGLDRAMDLLAVDAVATAVLVRLVPRPASDGGGLEVTWANAGHPPPVLMRPDGTVAFAVGQPDVLLGAEPDTPRHDRTRTLPPGSTFLLYTDGLVERRDATFDAGLSWLSEAVADLQALSPAEICDHLLDLVGGATVDDIALLVVRAPT